MLLNGGVRLLSIGDFARASRLSVKALRHYDSVGVLTPAQVDPHTGYRSYAPEQLRDALLVSLLRGAQVGLPTVRQILADPARLPELLADERARLTVEAARAQRSLTLVDRLAQGAVDNYSPHTVMVSDLRVLRRGAQANADTLEQVVPQTIELLLADAAAAGFDTTDSVVGRYPAKLDGQFVFDVNLPVPGCAGEDLHGLAGGQFVAVTHRGPFALLPLAYHALFAWLHEHALPADGPVRERYLCDPATDAEEDLLTEVLHPLPGS